MYIPLDSESARILSHIHRMAVSVRHKGVRRCLKCQYLGLKKGQGLAHRVVYTATYQSLRSLELTQKKVMEMGSSGVFID
jgi:hypothetical protein